MKRINFKLITIILFLQIAVIYCTDKNELSVTIKGNDYSGVYEGMIDISLCCEAYGIVNGWVAFDFSQNPPVILYDGVFYEGISIADNKLLNIEESEYSVYPVNTFGIFGENNGKYGLWYNYRSDDPEYDAGKTFLVKTGDISQAQSLIDKYRKEKDRFDVFFAKLKNYVIIKDYNGISSLVNYPIEDNSCSQYNNKSNKNLINEKEFASRIKTIMASSGTDFNTDFTYNRIEDDAPEFSGGIYVVYLGGQVHIKEINNEFKIIALLCYG
ncbi:MAG: hypothetical protein EHM58_17480 [Ignavibacteriae bacterium]|nr:MAG: hypothetical protein EHM58_17480 [Ignavibacteriota bacterium]